MQYTMLENIYLIPYLLKRFGNRLYVRFCFPKIEQILKILHSIFVYKLEVQGNF